MHTPPSTNPWSAITPSSESGSTSASEEDTNCDEDEAGVSSGDSHDGDGEWEDMATVEEEDYTSSSSSSSSSSSESSGESDSESEDGVLKRDFLDEDPNVVSFVPTGVRPAIVPLNASSLASRLSKFLPSMAAANEVLEVEKREGKLADRDLEEVGEGKPYIEMVSAACNGTRRTTLTLVQNLGLGILEESPDLDSSRDTENEVEADDERDESDVLDRLMGREKVKHETTPGIVLVEDES